MLQKNKIDELVERARACEAGVPPLTLTDLRVVEERLQVYFAEDFTYINERYSYECLYGACIEFFCLYDSRDGYSQVVEETERFRSAIQLPLRYVMLCDMGDAGAVFIETRETPDTPSPVIYCDQEDIDNICSEKPLQFDPTIWPSFTDFFEYLVEQEEAKLKDDA